jgi:integrase
MDRCFRWFWKNSISWRAAANSASVTANRSSSQTALNLPWLFVSERQAHLTRQAVNYIVRVAGETAKLGRVWPHMLRHSCGYYLADQGTDLRTMPRRWAPVRGTLAIARGRSAEGKLYFRSQRLCACGLAWPERLLNFR